MPGLSVTTPLDLYVGRIEWAVGQIGELYTGLSEDGGLPAVFIVIPANLTNGKRNGSS
jgi:hypothetical protein